MPIPTRPEDFDLNNVAGLTEDVISAGMMVKAGKLMLLAKARLLAVAAMTERQTRQTYDFPETETEER